MQTASALIKYMPRWEKREVQTALLKDSPPSLPVENFNLPREQGAAQHACVPQPAFWARGTEKLAPTVLSFKDGFGVMIPSVNHFSMKKSADKVRGSRWFARSLRARSEPSQLFPNNNCLPDEPVKVITDLRRKHLSDKEEQLD